MGKAPANESRSEWGFFRCTRQVDNTEESRAQLHSFALDAAQDDGEVRGSVTLVKPMAGDGTDLMHGSFGRAPDPTFQLLS